MIVNLRGTNGSGKSSVGYALLGQSSQPVDVTPRVPGYRTQDNVVVIGRYTTACGGMDTVSNQSDARNAVEAGAQAGWDLFFEGILISTTFEPWALLSRKLRRELDTEIVWAILDTPLDLCLERVRTRNGGKKVNERAIFNKYTSCWRSAEKARAIGETVVVIDHRDAIAQVRGLYG